MKLLARFVAVGLFNTAIGYAIILAGLWLGLGDYGANVASFVLGFPVSFTTHRLWTYGARAPAKGAEALRYALAVGVAFLLNLGVVAVGRRLGFVESPLVQLAAIVTYAGALFVLTRFFVFHAHVAVRD